jgi:hypothetical protein
VTGALAVGSTMGSLSVDETVFSPVEVVSLQATGRRCQLGSREKEKGTDRDEVNVYTTTLSPPQAMEASALQGEAHSEASTGAPV